MKRNYTTSDNVTGVTYFVGTEIEHTPAFGKKTLFVVGIQDPDEILELVYKNDCTHVYLGANQSFKITGEYGSEAENHGWDAMFKAVVEAGLWVTLDFDLEYIDFDSPQFWIKNREYVKNDQYVKYNLFKRLELWRQTAEQFKDYLKIVDSSIEIITKEIEKKDAEITIVYWVF